MALEYRQGSVLQSTLQTVTNTVNCVGVMGKGLALEFRKKFPAMFQRYKYYCETGHIQPGKLYLWKPSEGDGQWVLNFPTKLHWRDPSKLEWVAAGLDKFLATYEDRGVTSVAWPQLGCRNGGLDWDTQVRPLMEEKLSNLPIPVEIWIWNG
jgi:O-acetyl-ADP-ribose deacetylase (regulator of RNase III)